jgi:hypothetical protein
MITHFAKSPPKKRRSKCKVCHDQYKEPLAIYSAHRSNSSKCPHNKNNPSSFINPIISPTKHTQQEESLGTNNDNNDKLTDSIKPGKEDNDTNKKGNDGKWDSLLLCRTVWPLLDLCLTNHSKHKKHCDNVFSWSDLLEKALSYMECQLHVCLTYQLSLSLRKSCIFSEHFDFVGIDVGLDRNFPAMSKHQLLEHWSQPKFVRNVAKIVRFAQFYGKLIPQLSFELPHFTA